MQFISCPPRRDWDDLVKSPVSDEQQISDRVHDIIEDVRLNGDKALYALSKSIDGVSLANIKVSLQEIESAYSKADPDLIEAMKLAAQNIEKFHKVQSMSTPVVETVPGVRCWQKSLPVEKVGIYVPGGTAPLFSTLLMLAVPAKLAGCGSIIVCSPPDKHGSIHPNILTAAKIAGIDKIYKSGGAQAIAAMAFGTESIPGVYKIFGPGNRYVTFAKQKISLSGIAIDMPAGPSEVAVIADHSADPEFLAWDLLSQAEHGADSQVILATESRKLAEEVKSEIDKVLNDLPRKDMAEKALQESKIIEFDTLNTALEFVNYYAPEHLIINTENADALADKVTNAGSVFIGSMTPESAGDYASGTNHTLPTNACARAYSGVNLESFKKIITFQQINKDGMKNIGPAIERLAAEEGLEAHRKAVSVRLQKDGS